MQPTFTHPCPPTAVNVVFLLIMVTLWAASIGGPDHGTRTTADPRLSNSASPSSSPESTTITKTPLSFFASDAFSGFTQELLSAELQSLSPQNHSFLLFDEHECGFDSVTEWHQEALQSVYDQRLMRLSRAMNLDLYSHDVWSYQSDYACVLLAERKHTEWRHARKLPPSRVLIVVQRGTYYTAVAKPYMLPNMPGIASCKMAEQVWDDLMYNNGTNPSHFFWLLNAMSGWDCDVVVNYGQSLYADWYQEYDMVFTMSWFYGEKRPWHFYDVDANWTNPWLSLQEEQLQKHSPVIFIAPHEPETLCGGSHVPPTSPHCPVFLDNYACMDQPPNYWQQPDSRQGPLSLSTVVSYHYDVSRVQKRWYSDTTVRSVVVSASKRFKDLRLTVDWLAERGFAVDSFAASLCRPMGTCNEGKSTSRPQELEKMAMQKYGILHTVERQSSGQLIAELSMLGVPVFSIGPKLFHRLLQHPFLHCGNYEELKRKIIFLEDNPHLYEQLRAYIARRLPFIELGHMPQPYHLVARAQTVLRHSLHSGKVDMFDRPFVPNRTVLEEYSRLCSIRR